jgi:hypothetical protein
VRERRTPRRLAGVFVLLMLAACSWDIEDPPPVTEADVIGDWCGLPAEVVRLRPDNTFVVSDASNTFTTQLLQVHGYVDDYRVRTEFGGVRPTSLEGRWAILRLDGVALWISRIGDREVDESFGLGLEYDGEWRVTYPIDDSSDRHRLMSRCGPSSSPSAVQW